MSESKNLIFRNSPKIVSSKVIPHPVPNSYISKSPIPRPFKIWENKEYENIEEAPSQVTSPPQPKYEAHVLVASFSAPSRLQ
jgi:hypothetical protein